MSWEDTKLRLQVFGVALALLCPIFLIWQAAETRTQLASTTWPSVPGEVQETIAKTWVDKDRNTKYYGRVVYHYVVAGKEYTSDLTDLGPGAKRSDRQTALADVASYHPGMKVTVYYDPHDPGRGVLETGIPPIHLGLLIGLGVGSLIGWVVVLLTIRGWLKERRRRKEQTADQSNQPVPPITDPPLDVDEVMRQFGKPTDVFRPGLENVIAGMIIGGLLIVGGGLATFFMARVALEQGARLPWYRDKGHSWVSVLAFGGFGLLALGGGILLVFGMRRLLAHRILVCPNGLVRFLRRGVEACRWEDVAAIQETVLHEHLPILKGGLKYALPAGKSRSYVVHRRDGKEFGFDGNTVKGLGRFGKLLRQEAEAHGISWKTVEASD